VCFVCVCVLHQLCLLIASAALQFSFPSWTWR